MVYIVDAEIELVKLEKGFFHFKAVLNLVKKPQSVSYTLGISELSIIGTFSSDFLTLSEIPTLTVYTFESSSVTMSNPV